MAEICCRSCKSPDCHGCNMYILEQKLKAGGFDSLMNENRAIRLDVDVAPVVRGHKVTHNRPIAGHWVSGELDGGWDGMEGRVWVPPLENNPVEYCSECGKRLDDTFQKYCPNCGARMDGSNDESFSSL